MRIQAQKQPRPRYSDVSSGTLAMGSWTGGFLPGRFHMLITSQVHGDHFKVPGCIARYPTLPAPTFFYFPGNFWETEATGVGILISASE